WKPAGRDDDEEVDMIPLIDVSLVLLIFFMMTAGLTGAAGFRFFGLPPTEDGDVTAHPTKVWVGIRGAKGGPYSCSVGVDGKAATEENRGLPSPHDAVVRLQDILKDGPPVELTINAEAEVPAGVVRDLTVAIEKKLRAKVSHKYTGVSGK